MVPTVHDVHDLASTIFATTLDMELEPRASTDEGPWPLPAVEAQVHITGTWRGVVVLHTSEVLASRIAHVMLALGRRSPTVEDVQDAFGEVANMIGGNIKGIVSEHDAHLSLPSVVTGPDYAVRVPRSHELLRVEMTCGQEPLVITLLQAAAA